MDNEDLELQISAEADSADESLARIENLLGRIADRLTDVFGKLEGFGAAFDNASSPAKKAADGIGKGADKAASSLAGVERQLTAIQDKLRETDVMSKSGSLLSAVDAGSVPDGALHQLDQYRGTLAELSVVADAAKRSLDKVGAESPELHAYIEQIDSMSSRLAAIRPQLVSIEAAAEKAAQTFERSKPDIGWGSSATAGPAPLDRNVSGYSDVGTLIDADTAKANERYAKAIESAYQKATNAIARMYNTLEAKVNAGGSLTASEEAKYQAAQAHLDALAKEYAAIRKAGAELKDVDFAPIDTGHDFENLRALSDANRQARETSTSIDAMTKKLNTFLTRMETKAGSGGIVSKADEITLDRMTRQAAALGINMSQLQPRIDAVLKASGRNQLDKDLAKAEKRVHQLQAQLERLRQSKETALANGRSVSGINTRIAQTTTYLTQADQALSALRTERLAADADGAAAGFARMSSVVNTVAGHITAAVQKMKQLASRIDIVGKAARRLHGSMAGLWRLLKYRLLRTFIADAINDMKTALQYVATVDSSFNRVLNGIRTGFANLKAAVASAFLPLISGYGPAAISIMDKLAAAINRAGMALAALLGQKSYRILSASVSDTAAGFKDAAGSAKELQNTLAGFDTFNLLDDTKGSGGGSSGGDVTYTDQTIKLDLEEGSTLSKLAKIGEQVRKIAGSISGILSTAWKNFKKALGSDGKSTLLDDILTGVSAVADFLGANSGPISDVLTNIMLIAKDLWDVVKLLLEDIGTLLFGWTSDDTAGEKIQKVADGLGKVHEWLEKNKELVKTIIEIVGGVVIIAPILAGLVQVIGFLGQIKTLLGPIGTAIASAVSALGPMGILVAALVGILAGLIALVVDNWDWMSNVWKAWWRDTTASIKEWWAGVKSSVSEWWENSKSKASATWEDIKKTASGQWEAIKTKATEIWDSIKSYASGKWDDISQKASEIWTNVGSWASGVWDDVKNAFKDMWEGLWNWVQNSSLAKFFNGIGDGIRNAVSGIGNFFSGGTAKKTKATAHAYGGTINRGQFFLANERGPELVGTIGGRSAVANQSQVYTAMYDGIYQAMIRAMGYGSGGGETTENINLYLDSEKVYTSVVKRNKAKTKQTGKNPLLV